MKSVRGKKAVRLRPQNGMKLRALREARQLRQAEFAEQVNSHMRELIPGLSAIETLTQTMVSDLELGNADLSVLHLFAVSNFFGVTPGELLNDGLQSVGKSEINVGMAAELQPCKMAESALASPHPYFCQKLGDGSFFVCSWFPSGFFLSDECLACRLEALPLNAEHIEFYPVDALVNFLFSPVGYDSKPAKLAMLGRMLRYFGSSIYRRIYFMPVHLHSRFKDPCMRIASSEGQVTFLFPTGDNRISFMEVNNQAFSETLYGHYSQGGMFMQDSLSLLDIAYKTLSLEDGADHLAALRFFYQQCELRTGCAAWLKECFTPEVQQYLDKVSVFAVPPQGVNGVIGR